MATTVAGCAQTDVVAERKPVGIIEGGADDVDDANDANDAEDEVPECDQKGPRIRVGDSIVDPDGCETVDSPLAFRYALCVCSDYPGGAGLTTDSFDSSKTDMDRSSKGGSVGINEDLQTGSSTLVINGSLRVAGDRGVFLSDGGEIRVEQDLEVRSRVEGNNAVVTVGGDARIGGNVGIDTFDVEGTLSMPSDATLQVLDPPRTNPDREVSIQVEPPCVCAGEGIKHIPTLVAQASSDNDNELLDFDISELENYSGPINKYKLPCGRFYLTRLNGTGPLDIYITGRAALYVTEQVNFQDRVTISLESGADFELYLANSMVASETSILTFGAVDNPARTRLFVGKSDEELDEGTLELQGLSLFSGHIYAPHLELVVGGKTEVYGSVFVRRVQLDAPLTIYYDRNPDESHRVCSD